MPLFNSTVNNRVTQSDPIADDASFQFVDVRDLGTIDSLLKHTPHGVVNWVEVRWIKRPESGWDKIIQMHTKLLRWWLNMTLRISQGSASTNFRWRGHSRHCFVQGFFRDNPSNFYWNRLIFDREGAKNKLAQFFETRCIYRMSKKREIFWHFSPNGWEFLSKFYTPITRSNLHWTTNFYSIICNFDEVMPY